MSHAKHEHEELLLVDLVDDSVVAGADPPFARATDELHCCGRARVVGEKLEHALDSSADVGSELLQLS
jgi:hypothetical protein